MSIYGVDYLGGAAFQNLVLKNHENGWAAGFFGEEFGNVYPLIRKLAATGLAPAIRVQALWDATHRYGTAEQMVKVKQQLKRLCNIANNNLKVEFYFSPYCEHNLKAAEMEKTLQECRKILTANKCNNITLVNCVWQGETIRQPDVVNEVHGNHAAPDGNYIFSFDGLDCYNANTKKKKQQHAKAQIFFFWTISMNLKKKENEKVTVEQRLKRSYRPQACHIKAMVALKAAKGQTNVPKEVTIKPMSEDCGDLKSNKLLVLLKGKFKEVKLIRNNKKQTDIETLRRYDPPTGDFYRYYASKAGYEYVKKNLVKIKADGKILKYEDKDILFNPAWRDGTYRD